MIRAAVLFAVCLTVALTLLVSCATTPPPPAGLLTTKTLPAWLFCVEKDDAGRCAIYRSAQPTRAQFQAMREQLGLQSDVKLNSALEGRDELPDGVARYEHPMLPAGPVDHDDIAATLDDIEAAPKPLLIHCTHGEDRTGLVVGLYRFKHGSWATAAWGEMLAYGFHTSLIGLADAFKRETGWQPSAQ